MRASERRFGAAGAVRDVLAVADCRRIETGWFASLAGELAGTIALLVYSHEQGGAALVAVYGVTRTLPAILVTPAVVSAADRIAPDHVIRVTVALRALLLAAAAIGAFVGAPAAVVIGSAAIGSWLAGTYRPIQASALPWLARTPGELTAANVVAALAENAGTLLGPVVAGFALALLGVPAGIAFAAALLAVSTAAIWRLEVPRTTAGPPGEGRSAFGGIAAGVADLGSLAPPAGVAVLVMSQTFVRGALTVLTVVLALDVLVLGDAAVGWLTAATGIGGLVGGVIAGALLSDRRLARGFVAGLFLWGIPLAVLGAVPHPGIAYAALVIVGIGNSLEDISLYTLMPRAFRARAVGQAIGALEIAVLVGLAAGSLAAPLLASVLGAPAAIGTLGAALTLLAVFYTLSLARLDAALPAPGPELELLRRNPIFAPLPLATVELLSRQLTENTYEPGVTVLREGDPGDRFHLIADGTASVSVDGTERRLLGRGDGFGEIALLRDIPRTATVTAREPLRTLALGRADFLAAIGSSRVAAATAGATADARLSQDERGGRPV